MDRGPQRSRQLADGGQKGEKEGDEHGPAEREEAGHETGQQEDPSGAPGPIKSDFVEDFSWGRSFSGYVGRGYLPEEVAERLEGLDVLEQLFMIRREMKAKIRYESGRLTVRRPGKQRGLDKPVTYASNIWNRGYANCAGLCIVFAAALQHLRIPYCIASTKSPTEGVPKHAILQVGFPENADTKVLNRHAHRLWDEYYGRKSTVRRDKETNEPKWVKLFCGLKFTKSSPGSKAAQKKGAGHWLWVDPQVNIGYYLHLIEHGYMVQDDNRFSFAMAPEIKAWSSATGLEEAADLADGPTEEASEALD